MGFCRMTPGTPGTPGLPGLPCQTEWLLVGNIQIMKGEGEGHWSQADSFAEGGRLMCLNKDNQCHMQ